MKILNSIDIEEYDFFKVDIRLKEFIRSSYNFQRNRFSWVVINK
jgi:hypothetical protein